MRPARTAALESQVPAPGFGAARRRSAPAALAWLVAGAFAGSCRTPAHAQPPQAGATGAALYVVAHFTAHPGDAAKTAAIFRAHADASRRDPGNRSFTVVQDRTVPERFTTLEVWRDEAAMAAHQATAHYKAFHDGIGPLLAAPPDVQLNRLVR